MAGCNPSEEELEEMLLCCRYGDLEELIDFVNRFGNSWLETHVDENGNSALHMATANGHLGELPLSDMFLTIYPAL